MRHQMNIQAGAPLFIACGGCTFRAVAEAYAGIGYKQINRPQFPLHLIYG